jgi:two-component system cell cycle sensor histidine kinase/response regulator CckA
MSSPLKILHLEDDPLDRELVRETLEAEGIRCEVACVETREAFIEALDRVVPGLILADYKLPSFDGLSAMEIAKEKVPEIPFILVSGTMGEEPAIEALRNGATDYVMKHRMARLVPAVLRAMREVDERVERAGLQKQLVSAQRMEAVGLVTGGIAHDFNNALTGILGFSELLKVELKGKESALRDLDEIRRCAERASTLTRQLLTFARRQAMDPVMLDLNAVVGEAMRLLRKVVGARVDVEERLSETLPTVMADQGQIEQVLMNLCINSRDAMSGGGRIVVETSKLVIGPGNLATCQGAPPGVYAVLSIADNGSGMDEEVRVRAFDPFFTTKSPDKGTGLGLPVVYGIVKQHKGFVTLVSEPGKGTTVRVCLPAVEGAAAGSGAVSVESVRGGTETILLAEDDDMIRDLIVQILSGLGYKVMPAPDGREAVEMARGAKDISLAIIDVVMPRMSGKETYEGLKGDRPGMKVIFISGYSPDSVRESMIMAPDTPFLQKPFGVTILAKKVREVLDAPSGI